MYIFVHSHLFSYNLLCLLIHALGMIQWCLLGSNLLMRYVYFCVPTILRVPTAEGKDTSEEELKRARAICDFGCLVVLAIVFYIGAYIIFLE